MERIIEEKRQAVAHEAAMGKGNGGAHPPRMALYVCGLNHRRAPIAVRERYALSPEQCGALLRQYVSQGLADQILILSTCNRTEFYAYSARPQFARELREAFLALGRENGDGDEPPIDEYEGDAAVRHLFAVGSGLDSMILGENQIKQQLTQAYELCRAEAATGPDLNRLIEASHRAGKRIRTETDLNAGTLCMAKAAVLRGEQVLGGLEGKVCMVIGAGKIGQIAARPIAERHPARLWIVNRTVERAGAIAAELGAEAYGLDSLDCLLPEAQFILGAAYAPELILDRARYEHFCAEGRPERVCMVDAAVPRIIDPAIGELAGVELFDIEHMEEIVEENRQRRQEQASDAWVIVEEEVRKYLAAQHSATLGPVIQKLHAQVDEIFDEEREKLEVFCPPELIGKLKATHHRIKQRLMHEVIQEIKTRLMGRAPGEGHGH